MTSTIISTLKHIIKIVFLYLTLLYSLASIKNTMQTFKYIFISSIILILSLILNDTLVSYGYKVYTSTSELFEYTRSSGISGMNPNALAALLALVSGLAINLFLSKKINLIILLILLTFLFVGILYTGSRTGLFLFSLNYIIFLLDKRSIISFNFLINSLLILVVAIVVFLNYGSTLKTRILEEHQDEEYVGLGRRAGYWVIYVDDIIKNPHYLIIGNTKEPTYKRSPHNFYVLVLFRSGISIIIYLLFQFSTILIQSTRLINRKQTTDYLNPLFILIPQFLYWIPGIAEVFYWFLLILGLSFFPSTIKPIVNENSNTS